VKFGEAAVTQEEIHLGIVGANAKKAARQAAEAFGADRWRQSEFGNRRTIWRILDLGIFADISDRNDLVYAFWHFL